jgi:hypothetical protein
VLEVVAPEPVAKLIREYTLLGRWRQRADYDPSQLPLFVRRAPAEVRELLEAEGYFAGDVEVRVIEGGVRIEVTAGPQTVVGLVDIVLHGEVEAPRNEALRERTRLLAVVWCTSIARASAPTPMPGSARMRLSAQTCAPPMPACFSTCWKCVFTALNTLRKRRSTRDARSVRSGSWAEAWVEGPDAPAVGTRLVAERLAAGFFVAGMAP